jgi:hypothetical protein
MTKSNEIIVALPEEVAALAAQVSEKKQTEVKDVLNQIFTGTDDWRKQVDAIEIKDINDKLSIDMAEAARKNAKNARLNAEKIFDAKRKEVQEKKSEYDTEDKLWLKAKQVMQIKFKEIEDKAEWKANYVKRFEAEQHELRTQNRILEVEKYAVINRIEFEFMGDESFKTFLSGLKLDFERREEEDRKAREEAEEQERINKLHDERVAGIIHVWDYVPNEAKHQGFGGLSQNEFLTIKTNAEKIKADTQKKQAELEAEAERLRKEADAQRKQLEQQRRHYENMNVEHIKFIGMEYEADIKAAELKRDRDIS